MSEADYRRIPTWWRHDCGVNHRYDRTLAECMTGEEVRGEGSYVVLPCRRYSGLLASLHRTEKAAREAADTKCGHEKCNKNHRIVRLRPENRTMTTPAIRITVRGHMHPAEKAAHALLILCTFGLWVPFYLIRKRVIERNAATYRIGA
jgi:hypothetical protein